VGTRHRLSSTRRGAWSGAFQNSGNFPKNFGARQKMPPPQGVARGFEDFSKNWIFSERSFPENDASIRKVRIAALEESKPIAKLLADGKGDSPDDIFNVRVAVEARDWEWLEKSKRKSANGNHGKSCAASFDRDDQ